MKSLLCVFAISLAAFAAFAGKSRTTALPGTSGNYTAQASYDLDEGPGPDTGTITARVRKSKSGKKLRLNLSGVVDPSDTPVPISASLRFDDKKRVRANSLILGYLGNVATKVSRYRLKGHTLKFTLRAQSGATISGSAIGGSVKYQFKLGRRSFQLSGSGALLPLPAGTPVPFLLQISGKLAK